MPEPVPELIYDGDCAVCRDWIHHWQTLTGERVCYRSYQTAGGDYPKISNEEFRRAIQLIDTDGSVYSGAAAAFKVVSLAPGRGLGWRLYRHLPGFAWCSERAYDFCAQHRGLLQQITRLLLKRSPSRSR